MVSTIRANNQDYDFPMVNLTIMSEIWINTRLITMRSQPNYIVLQFFCRGSFVIIVVVIVVNVDVVFLPNHIRFTCGQ